MGPLRKRPTNWGKERPKLEAKVEAEDKVRTERSGQSRYIRGDFGIIFQEGRVVAGKD